MKRLANDKISRRKNSSSSSSSRWSELRPLNSHKCFAIEAARRQRRRNTRWCLIVSGDRVVRAKDSTMKPKDHLILERQSARRTTLPKSPIPSINSVLPPITTLLLLLILLTGMQGIDGEKSEDRRDSSSLASRIFLMNSLASIDDSMPAASSTFDISSSIKLRPPVNRYVRSHYQPKQLQPDNYYAADSDDDPHDDASDASQETSEITRQDESQRSIEDIVEQAIKDGHLLDPQKWAEYNERKKQEQQMENESEEALRYPRENKAYYENIHTHAGEVEDGVQSDGKIVFPDERQEDHRRESSKVKESTVPVCQGSTFCETPPYYPEDFVKEAMRKDTKLKYLASVDVVTNVVQRIDITDDVPLCLSTEQLVFPKTAEDRNKDWKFILNQDNFTQAVRIETCANEDTPCRMYDSIPAGYKTSCKQKYIYRQLAAIVDGKIAKEMFRFPSSCCCHVKFVGSALSRMGFSSADQQQQQQQPTTPARKRRNV